jgi:hypothetical protein
MTMIMIKHLLTVIAYVLSTFLVQGASHFAIAAKHYASIPFMRAEPVFALGFASMLIQGTIISLLYSEGAGKLSTISKAVRHAWLAGALIASYIVLAEPGKYAVASIPQWVGVELPAAAAQFTLFGVLMGLIHGRDFGSDTRGR